MRYIKPPLTFQQQVELLKSRGLIVPDIKKAIHVLEHINYYRLSVYFHPYQVQKDAFEPGVTLEDILYLYEFDRRLRNLLSEGLARIEISAKTQIAYYIALKYGAFGHLNNTNFNFKQPLVHITHAEWLTKVRESVKHSHETFKKHFFTKYDDKDLPIWMAIELMSFGQVSRLYRGMHKHNRQDIARGYFKIDQRLMSSWLHTIVYIRNLCAHHSRIWNRKLAIRPLLDRKDRDWEGIDHSRIFSVLLLIKNMMHFRDKWNEWSGKLLILLGEFSEVDTSNMGFPENWRELLFDSKLNS
ncbi:MAG: Abi family protein [Phycisphaerae bacterium]|nr:Abi family protein [Phycisphaerae bacterium]